MAFFSFLYQKIGVLNNYLDFKILKIPDFDLLRQASLVIIKSESQAADKAVPLLLTEVSGDGKAVLFQSGTNLVLTPFNDPGGDENAVLSHEAAHIGGQGNDDIGDNICQHHIVARSQRPAKSGVADDVPGVDPEPVRPDAVVGDIITAVNGQPVSTVDEVGAIKNQLNVGDSMTFTIWREGETFDVDVVLMDTNDIYGK